jgi:hypothetical protein
MCVSLMLFLGFNKNDAQYINKSIKLYVHADFITSI